MGAAEEEADQNEFEEALVQPALKQLIHFHPDKEETYCS